MSYTISDAARNAAIDAIVDRIDLGSANPTGAIQFRNAGGLIASCAFANPAFGSAVAGVATMDTSGTVDGTVTPSGASTIDRFTIVNRDGTAIITGAAGSVATSGADINLSSVTVNQNDVVEVTGLTATMPATGP